jgi:hypothetical protein
MDGSFYILIWVTLFETLKNPPFPPFQVGMSSFPPFERGIKGDFKTLKTEFITLILNHAINTNKNPRKSAKSASSAFY